jgi:hypothetical protein
MMNSQSLGNFDLVYALFKKLSNNDTVLRYRRHKGFINVHCVHKAHTIS